MLVIRMQRTGRKGHAMFRVVVQDSRRTPSSGRIVAALGSYDPHTKAVTLSKERAQHYLDHGAQPSDRAARILKAEGLKLPAWVVLSTDKKRSVRNVDKRRSTRPEEPAAEVAPEAPAEVSEAVAENGEADETQATEPDASEPAENSEAASEAEATEPEAVDTAADDSAEA